MGSGSCLLMDEEFSVVMKTSVTSHIIRRLTEPSPIPLFNPDLPTIVHQLMLLIAALAPCFHRSRPTTQSAQSHLLPGLSRLLNANTQQSRKRPFGCVWAVEKWRTYLWGRRFTLRTDHQALTTLLTTKGADRAGMRIARWSARLLCFSYDVAHVPGSKNNTADCLSRLPLPSAADEPEVEPEFVAMLSADHLSAVSPSEFAAASASCPELCALRAQIADGWPPSPTALGAVLRSILQAAP